MCFCWFLAPFWTPKRLPNLTLDPKTAPESHQIGFLPLFFATFSSRNKKHLKKTPKRHQKDTKIHPKTPKIHQKYITIHQKTLKNSPTCSKMEPKMEPKTIKNLTLDHPGAQQEPKVLQDLLRPPPKPQNWASALPKWLPEPTKTTKNVSEMVPTKTKRHKNSTHHQPTPNN